MLETDLLRLTWIADPQISPDGSRIAFTRVTIDREKDAYQTSLWIVAASGGKPRALTFGPKDSQPRWSPDGTRLAFVRGAEEGKPAQLYVLPMNGGEAVRLTELVKGAGNPAWSPDGTRLAFTSATDPARDKADEKKPANPPVRIVTRPMFRLDNEGFLEHDHPDHVWVVEAGGGTPRPLTGGRYVETSPAWSRDGKRVLFLSDRRPEPWFGGEDVDLYAVAADRTTPATDESDGLERIANHTGPIFTFREGADGRIVAVGATVLDPPRSYDQRDLLLFEGPGPMRKARVLTSAYDFEVDGDIAADGHPPRGGGSFPIGFARDGRSVLTVVGRHGSNRLARITIESGKVEELTEGRHEVQVGSLSADGRFAALTLGSVERPGVLAVCDIEAGTVRVLVDPNEAVFAETRLGEVEEVWYDSFDGTKIQGWIVKPPDFDPKRKYPLILEIHGGPHVAYGVGFFHEFRVLAAAGYVVLYTNPRGSTTYGQDFGNVIQYRYPGDDYKDLMAGVDFVAARGYVDPERMGVTGGSGGGLLTNWTIGQTDRFKAAITQRCVSDWSAFWYGCDFTMFTPWWFKKPPFEDLTEYVERSPVMLTPKVKTPLLVLHSDEDWRTPTLQGEAMFRALVMQRKPAVMARFPGEGHELSRSGAPSRRVQNQRLIRRWFDRWLLGKDAPEFDQDGVLREPETVDRPAASAREESPVPAGVRGQGAEGR
ncbi:MAG: prolyl oligopeptidase family serine peptidase [Candidatus Eiseniibacteriota bacterium]